MTERQEKVKTCPVCDGSGQMPDAMRRVIYKPEVGRDVQCWECYGKGSIPQDQDVAPIWTMHKAVIE